MSSIKYEILSKCHRFKEGAPGPSKNTIEQYKTHAIRYGKWAKRKYGCRRFEELKDHIPSGYDPHVHRSLLLCVGYPPGADP